MKMLGLSYQYRLNVLKDFLSKTMVDFLDPRKKE